TVKISPANYQGGPHAGTPLPAGCAEVTVKYNQRRFFSSIWGSSKVPISARAVAQGEWAPSDNGFMLLAPSGTAATMSGRANIKLVDSNGNPYGTFIVDSTGPNAIKDSSSVKSV